MDFPGFDIEADLAPLTALHAASSSSNANNPRQPSLSTYDFSPPQQHVPDSSSSFRRPPTFNGSSDCKVFFITNCGSLLGRTIAQVALDRGHYVAACAREKHLADLSVILLLFGGTRKVIVVFEFGFSGYVCFD